MYVIDLSVYKFPYIFSSERKPIQRKAAAVNAKDEINSKLNQSNPGQSS